jgi:hypothetical protein
LLTGYYANVSIARKDDESKARNEIRTDWLDHLLIDQMHMSMWVLPRRKFLTA